MGLVAGALVAGAAVSAAGAITSSAMSADASKKAAGAAAGANKKFAKQQTADVGKFEAELNAAKDLYNANLAGISAAVAAIDPKIKIPDYSLLGTPDVYKTNKKGEIIRNKKTGLPVIKNRGKASAVLEGIKAANEITTNSLYQLEVTLPGAADARKKAMEDIKEWEGRLEDQYQEVQKAYPLLNQAGEMILSSEDKLKMSEEEFKKAEERLIQSEGVLNRSERQYEAAGDILQQQLPLIQQARDVAGNLLLGDLPDVTKRQITRAIAETGGAGYNPAAAGRTSGFQVPQGMLSQNLAEAAEERQRFGLSAVSNLTGQTAQMSAGQANIGQGLEGVARGYQAGAQGFQNIGQGYQAAAQGYQNLGAGLQNVAQGIGAAGAASANIGEAARGMQATNMAWQSLSQGFLQNTPQMMGIALTGRGQDIEKKQFEINAALNQQNILANLAGNQFNAATGVAQNVFDARTGLAQNIYQGQQQNIQNNLAAAQANAQMVGDIGQGIGSTLTAAVDAYNQYATAANASTTPNAAGFYKGQIGAANAYKVAPSQLSYQKGQGYYYTPSGVYGTT